MIVRLDKWSKHPAVARFCERLLGAPGVRRKSTPQRCVILHDGVALASIGLEDGTPVVEFRAGRQHYAEAHGSAFVRPHPLAQMAREGWLQGRPNADDELEQIIDWISSALDPGAEQ